MSHARDRAAAPMSITSLSSTSPPRSGDAEELIDKVYSGASNVSCDSHHPCNTAEELQAAHSTITGDANATAVASSLVNVRDEGTIHALREVFSPSPRPASAASIGATDVLKKSASASEQAAGCAPPEACAGWAETSIILTAVSVTAGEGEEQYNTPMLSPSLLTAAAGDVYTDNDAEPHSTASVSREAGDIALAGATAKLTARGVMKKYRDSEDAAMRHLDAALSDEAGAKEKAKMTAVDEMSAAKRAADEEEEEEVVDDNYHLESAGGAPVTVRLMRRIQREQHRQRVRVRRNMHPASRALRSSPVLRPRREHSHARSSATSSSWRYSSTASSASSGRGDDADEGDEEAVLHPDESGCDAEADAAPCRDTPDEACLAGLLPDAGNVFMHAGSDNLPGTTTPKQSLADASIASSNSQGSGEPALTPLRLQSNTPSRTDRGASNMPATASSLPRRRSGGGLNTCDVSCSSEATTATTPAGAVHTTSSARPVGRKRGSVFERLSTLTPASATPSANEAAVQGVSAARKMRAPALSSQPPQGPRPAVRGSARAAQAATTEQAADEGRRERRVKPLLDSVRAVTMAASARQGSEQHLSIQQALTGPDGKTDDRGGSRTSVPLPRSRRATLPQPTHLATATPAVTTLDDASKRRSVAPTPPRAGAHSTETTASDGGSSAPLSQQPATPPTLASRSNRRLRTVLQHSPVTGAQAMLSLIEAHHSGGYQAIAARSQTQRLLPELVPAEEACRVVTVVFDLDETLCNNRCLTPALLRPGAISLLRHLRSLYPSPRYRQPPARRPGTRLYDQSLPGKVLSPAAAYQPRRPSASTTDVVASGASSGLLLEMVLWTASVETVARRVVQRLDPEGTVFDYTIYRDARWYSEGGYTKNLRHLGRDMERVVIVENAPGSVMLNPKHAILVHDFVRNRADRQLYVVRAVLTDWLHHVNAALCPSVTSAGERREDNSDDNDSIAPHAISRDRAKGRGVTNLPIDNSLSEGHDSSGGADGGGLHTARKPNAEEGGESVMPQQWARREGGTAAGKDAVARLVRGVGGRPPKATRRPDAEAPPPVVDRGSHNSPSAAPDKERLSDLAALEVSAKVTTSRGRPSGGSLTMPSSTSHVTVDSFLAHHPFIVPETNYIRLSAIREAMQRFIASCSDGTAVESTRPSLTRRSTSLRDEVLNRLPGNKPMSTQPDVPPPPASVQHLLASRGSATPPPEAASIATAQSESSNPRTGLAHPRKVHAATSIGAADARDTRHTSVSLTMTGTSGMLPRWPREAERLQLRR